MKSINSLLILLLITILISGCSGGRVAIKAEKVNYPVSASSALYSKDLKLLNEGDFDVLGNFEFTLYRWSIFWTMIPLESYNKDISDKLNELIKAKNGQGVINLKISSNRNFLGEYLGFIPIIPSYVKVIITGEIIKQKV